MQLSSVVRLLTAVSLVVVVTSTVKVCVVGGGVAGLSAARTLVDTWTDSDAASVDPDLEV